MSGETSIAEDMAALQKWIVEYDFPLTPRQRLMRAVRALDNGGGQTYTPEVREEIVGFLEHFGIPLTINFVLQEKRGVEDPSR